MSFVVLEDGSKIVVNHTTALPPHHHPTFTDTTRDRVFRPRGARQASALTRMENLRRNADALGGTQVQDLLFGSREAGSALN